MQLFHSDADYNAFVRLLDTTLRETPCGLLAFCVMPTHWHIVLRPSEPEQLSRWLHRLTVSHTMRWHRAHQSVGTGPIYQGRFKSFPIASDSHLRTVCRYVERTPLRAGLVTRAEEWTWSSLWHRLHPGTFNSLGEWPVARPSNWTAHVNNPQTETELKAIRKSLETGGPYGLAPCGIERDGSAGAERIERDGSAGAEGPSATPRPLCGPWTRPACAAGPSRSTPLARPCPRLARECPLPQPRGFSLSTALGDGLI